MYTVDPDGRGPIQVFCDMTTDGGGWTVFQRRRDGSVDFVLGWKAYKNGFGDPRGEFWLGNDKIHRLTSTGVMELRFDLEDFEENTRYAVYKSFTIADEDSWYRVTFGEYSGTAGDSFTYHKNMTFATKDRGVDYLAQKCALHFRGGWWYKLCIESNLNGPYRQGPVSVLNVVNWKHWRGYRYSLKSTEMKMRPQEN